MVREKLQNILRAEQRRAGFHLEDDEHVIFLFDGEGRRRSIFYAEGATAGAIQDEVDLLMNS